MNVYRNELRRIAKPAAVWGIALSLMTALLLFLYPAFHASASVVEAMLERFPRSVRFLMGIKGTDLSEFGAFFPFVMEIISEAAAVGGMLFGANALSREIHGKTADFLVSKPIGRSRILSEKLLAVLTGLFAINLFFVSVTLISAGMIPEIEVRNAHLAAAALPVFYMQLLYAAFGALLASAVPKIRMIPAIGVSSLLVFHFIGDVFFLRFGLDSTLYRYFVPFSFFETERIIASGTYETPFVLLWMGLIGVSLFLCFRFYRTKDIPSV